MIAAPVEPNVTQEKTNSPLTNETTPATIPDELYVDRNPGERPQPLDPKQGVSLSDLLFLLNNYPGWTVQSSNLLRRDPPPRTLEEEYNLFGALVTENSDYITKHSSNPLKHTFDQIKLDKRLAELSNDHLNIRRYSTYIMEGLAIRAISPFDGARNIPDLIRVFEFIQKVPDLAQMYGIPQGIDAKQYIEGEFLGTQSNDSQTINDIDQTKNVVPSGLSEAVKNITENYQNTELERKNNIEVPVDPGKSLMYILGMIDKNYYIRFDHEDGLGPFEFYISELIDWIKYGELPQTDSIGRLKSYIDASIAGPQNSIVKRRKNLQHKLEELSEKYERFRDKETKKVQKSILEGAIYPEQIDYILVLLGEKDLLVSHHNTWGFVKQMIDEAISKNTSETNESRYRRCIESINTLRENNIVGFLNTVQNMFHETWTKNGLKDYRRISND